MTSRHVKKKITLGALRGSSLQAMKLLKKNPLLAVMLILMLGSIVGSISVLFEQEKIEEDRLNEYDVVYGEDAPGSWWGWELFKKNTSYAEDEVETGDESEEAEEEEEYDEEYDEAGKNASDEAANSIDVAKNESIAVFYNVFTKTKKDVTYVKSIVNEQLSYRRPQHKVFVRSIGTSFDIDNTIRIRHDEKGDEPETLHLIWEYCKDHPSEKVAYIHSKGSFHPSDANDKFRRFLTRGALSEECETLPSTCNVCSSRMSPVPHPHTSGNMWLARCDYITKLIDPLEFAAKMSDVKFSAAWDAKNEYACAGMKRYAAEHWVHSHPTVMPCDLATDASFVWNYNNIPEADFEIDLQAAPRFDLEKYEIKNNPCRRYGFNLEDRLNEYDVVYGEDAPGSWWGWELFKKNTSHAEDEVETGDESEEEEEEDEEERTPLM